MSLVIGIPKALHYYTFIPLWERFFYELGLKVVESGATTKEIVDMGVRTAVTDACAPIKIFQGHAEWLAQRTDVVFIPRMVSFEGGYVFCPKFLGLPDMVRATIDKMPPIIDTVFDLRKRPAALLRSLVRLGRSLGAGQAKAFASAIRAIKHFKQAGWTGYLRRDSKPRPQARSSAQVTIGVVGYPYIVHDPFLSCGMVDLLESAGARVLTVEDVSAKQIRSEDKSLDKQLFWHYSNRTLKAAYYLMRHNLVDGLVHASAFSCGPDAIVGKILELDSKYEFDVPFLSVTVDEHSGRAGIMTRLEAFLDMLIRKKYAGAKQQLPELAPDGLVESRQGQRRIAGASQTALDGHDEFESSSNAMREQGRQVS